MRRNVVFIVVILAVLAGSSNAVAQHLGSYGVETGVNVPWIRVVPDSVAYTGKKVAGFNIGVFAIWSSSTEGRLKSQLVYSSNEVVLQTDSRPSCYHCQDPIQLRPRTYHTEYKYVSLLLTPIVNLAALGLDQYYILGGAKLDFTLEAKSNFQEKRNGEIFEHNRDLTLKVWNRFAYGGSFGIGGNLFEVTGRVVSLELRYNFQIDSSASGIINVQGRNRSLEFLVGIHF